MKSTVDIIKYKGSFNRPFPSIYISLFLTLVIGSVFSQTKSISFLIIEEGTSNAVPFAAVQLQRIPQKGAMSDINGMIVLEDMNDVFHPGDTLLLNALGYYEKRILLKDIKADNNIVALKPKAFHLKEVTIRPKDDLGKKIIKKAIELKNINSPANISYFDCNVYNKTIMDFIPNKEFYADSIIQKIKQKQEKRHLLISEKVSRKFFTQGVLDSDVIISNRVSGFSNPEIEDMNINVQPFHFYYPVITLYENNYINPINNSGLSNYNYFLKDTIIYNDDSLFVIEFTPKSINKSLLKGVVHISSSSYSIVNVSAEPLIKELAVLKIEQGYKKINNQYLPSQLNYELTLKKYPNKKNGLSIKSHSIISDYIFTSEKPEKKTIEKIPMDDARTTDLSNKEKETYLWTDSIGKIKKFDNKLHFISKLSNSRISFKKIDFDLSELSNNPHEDYRIGLGVYTNENIFKTQELGGYIAYGTKDKRIKYGAQYKWTIPAFKMSIKGHYKNDLLESGSFNYQFRQRNMLREMVKDSLNRIEQIGLSIQSKWKHFNFSFGVNNEEVKDDFYKSGTLTFTEIVSSIKVNLNKGNNSNMASQNINKYPIVNIDHATGTKWFKGYDNYHRINLNINYDFYLNRIGKENLNISLSKVLFSRPLPYYKLISGYGYLSKEIPFYIKNHFQTMTPYAFTHTKSIVMYYKHQFIKSLFYSKYSEPKLHLTTSAGYGSLTKNYLFKTFNRGYYESGIIIENLLKINYLNVAYIGLGAGGFINYGYYASLNIQDNIAAKMHLSILF